MYRLLLLLGAFLFGLFASVPAAAKSNLWVSSWASGQMLVDPKDALIQQSSRDLTVRQVAMPDRSPSAVLPSTERSLTDERKSKR